jgi:hypothetical protein
MQVVATVMQHSKSAAVTVLTRVMERCGIPVLLLRSSAVSDRTFITEEEVE